MGQVIYLFFEEVTLRWFQFQIIFSMSVEYDTIGVGAPPPSVRTQLDHLGRSNSR